MQCSAMGRFMQASNSPENNEPDRRPSCIKHPPARRQSTSQPYPSRKAPVRRQSTSQVQPYKPSPESLYALTDAVFPIVRRPDIAANLKTVHKRLTLNLPACGPFRIPAGSVERTVQQVPPPFDPNDPLRTLQTEFALELEKVDQLLKQSHSSAQVLRKPFNQKAMETSAESNKGRGGFSNDRPNQSVDMANTIDTPQPQPSAAMADHTTVRPMKNITRRVLTQVDEVATTQIQNEPKRIGAKDERRSSLAKASNKEPNRKPSPDLSPPNATIEIRSIEDIIKRSPSTLEPIPQLQPDNGYYPPITLSLAASKVDPRGFAEQAPPILEQHGPPPREPPSYPYATGASPFVFKKPIKFYSNPRRYGEAADEAPPNLDPTPYPGKYPIYQFQESTSSGSKRPMQSNLMPLMMNANNVDQRRYTVPTVSDAPPVLEPNGLGNVSNYQIQPVPSSALKEPMLQLFADEAPPVLEPNYPATANTDYPSCQSGSSSVMFKEPTQSCCMPPLITRIYNAGQHMDETQVGNAEPMQQQLNNATTAHSTISDHDQECSEQTNSTNAEPLNEGLCQPSNLQTRNMGLEDVEAGTQEQRDQVYRMLLQLVSSPNNAAPTLKPLSELQATTATAEHSGHNAKPSGSEQPSNVNTSLMVTNHTPCQHPCTSTSVLPSSSCANKLPSAITATTTADPSPSDQLKRILEQFCDTLLSEFRKPESSTQTNDHNYGPHHPQYSHGQQPPQENRSGYNAATAPQLFQRGLNSTPPQPPIPVMRRDFRRTHIAPYRVPFRQFARNQRQLAATVVEDNGRRYEYPYGNGSVGRNLSLFHDDHAAPWMRYGNGSFRVMRHTVDVLVPAYAPRDTAYREGTAGGSEEYADDGGGCNEDYECDNGKSHSYFEGNSHPY